MFRTLTNLAVVLAIGVVTSAGADEYVIDATHAAATFKVSHIGLSWTHGCFKDVSGSFSFDPKDVAKSAFTIVAKTDSIDTANAKRDEHLKSPDFFNAKQFPAITFQSTDVQKVQNAYQVTGNLTLHGVTKPVKFNMVGGEAGEFPKGVYRTGFTAELVVKRSEFGMANALQAVGDDVHIAVSFEGTKK